MKNILINGKSYKLKTSYLELNQKEFLKISYIRSKFLEKIPVNEYHALRRQAFFVLSGIPLRKLLKLDNIQLHELLPHIDFIFKEQAEFKKNLLPYFKLHWFGSTYFAPTGFFERCSMEEIAEAETAFYAAAGMKNIDKMYLLTAILYRKYRKDYNEYLKTPAYNGDLREPYNSQHARDRAELFKKKLPFYKVVAVYLFYTHFREKELINSPVLKIIFENNKPKQGLDLGWLETLLEVSNTKFGNFNETIKENWLTIMYNIALEMDKAKQKTARTEEEEIRSKF